VIKVLNASLFNEAPDDGIGSVDRNAGSLGRSLDLITCRLRVQDTWICAAIFYAQLL
jgi:hypothetical protein